jgi:hypothetical protein
MFTTEELAGQVVKLYCPHATPYDGNAGLRHGGVREEGRPRSSGPSNASVRGTRER